MAPVRAPVVRRAPVDARRDAVRAIAASASASESRSAKSFMVWNRSAGVFSSACITASSTSSGIDERTTWRLGTTSIECRAMIAIELGPVNGGCPISTSYSTHPRL